MKYILKKDGLQFGSKIIEKQLDEINCVAMSQ